MKIQINQDTTSCKPVLQNNHQEMKIQIEDIEPPLQNFTYLSYNVAKQGKEISYQVVIPKAPLSVCLEDVKQAIKWSNLDKSGNNNNELYYFRTRDSEGNIVEVLVNNNSELIPLLDGMIVLVNKNYTYVSYIVEKDGEKTKYQVVISKAPASVRLQDVKEVIKMHGLEEFENGCVHIGKYYFFTSKDSEGNIHEIRVTNDNEPIPLFDGMIVLSHKHVVEVCYQLIDYCGNRIDENRSGHQHGMIRLPSLKIPVTLEDVKRVMPLYIKNILDGENARFLFMEDDATNGLVKKELIIDFSEISVPEKEKKIKCQIMLTQNSIKKYHHQRLCEVKLYSKLIMRNLCIFLVLFISIGCLKYFTDSYSPNIGNGLLLLLSGFCAIFMSTGLMVTYDECFEKVNNGDSCIKSKA